MLDPNQIDDTISAEIPDADNDKQLFDTIIRNVVHGPCGPYNPFSKCMKDGHCTINYRRVLINETHHNDSGSPLHRRRAP